MNLCDLLDIEDPGIRLHDWENADLAIEVLTEKFKSKTSQEWAEAFQGNDVCANVIRHFREAASDPHFEFSKMIQVVSGSDGKPQRILGNPIKMSETPYQIRHAAPLLGQDNEKILKELGYSNANYKAFIDKSVI